MTALLWMGGCQTDASTPAPAVSTGDASAVIANAVAPAVASTPAGVVTVWVEGEGDARRLLARPASGGAAVEVLVGPVSMHGQGGPRLATSPDGAVYVAFVQERVVEGRRFAASTLWLARSDDAGATWGEPVRVHPDPGFPTGHTFHALAVADDGTVAVAWLDGTARDRWRLDQTAANATSAPVQLARHDGSHATGAHEPGTALAVARSTNGGRTFEAPVTVATGTCQCCRTALAAGDGAFYLAWRHLFEGGERDMALARSDDGGQTWTAPVRVHNDAWAIDGCPHAGPSLAVRGDGALVVAWPTGADDRMGIWEAVSTDRGATFAAPSPLLDAGAPFGQVAAARDGTGRVWLAWEDVRTTDVLVAQHGGSDTLRIAGTAPALTGTAAGWQLALQTPDGATFTSGS